jgi:putative hydrolase of the HAD superfamily
MSKSSRLAIEDYSAVFFDMNGTFMFDGDRFGPQQDYYATYRAIGGSTLTPQRVQEAVEACYAAFLRDYGDPKLTDCFPSLRECIDIHTDIPASEHGDIAKTIAEHEVGQVPSWAALAIRSVAERTPVAVVSNVWAPSHHWHKVLTSSGVTPLLSAAVFSSDIEAVKPSERPFLAALATLTVSSAEVLFVGDSEERDILPAKKLGMSTCLVGDRSPGSVADFQVNSIAQLAPAAMLKHHLQLNMRLGAT